MDVPLHSAARRMGLRHVAGRVRGHRRRRERVDGHERRRGARLHLFAVQSGRERLLRRRARRRQPVRRKPRVPGGGHRPPRVALPARPSRALGLRPAGRAESRRHHGGGPSGPRGRSGHQAGLRLRVRSRDGTPHLAPRGSSGAAVHRPRRKDGGDPAVSDEAGAIRTAGAHSRRRHRLHAGAPRRGSRDPRSIRSRPALRPAERTRHGARPGHRRRRELGGRGVRSRHGTALRDVDHGAHRREIASSTGRQRHP